MLYDSFELELVAEYYLNDGTTACEPFFTDEILPDDFDINPNNPETLEKFNVLKFFWTIYGHLPNGGVEALIDGSDYRHIKEQYDFLNTLLISYQERFNGKRQKT